MDFRQSRLLDPKWWRRLAMLLNALDRKNRATVLDASFRYYLAQITNPRLSDEGFGKSQDHAIECYYDLIGAVEPWKGKGYKDRKKKEFGDYRQMYIDAFGVDPSDPKFKEWEAEQIRIQQAMDDQAHAAAAQQQAELDKRLNARHQKGR